MAENQAESAATGSRGLCTDDTSLIGRVEPSSFGAAGDRLPVELSSSTGTALPGDIHTQFSCSGGGARTSGERDTTSQKRKLQNLKSQGLAEFQKLQELANEFQE